MSRQKLIGLLVLVVLIGVGYFFMQLEIKAPLSDLEISEAPKPSKQVTTAAIETKTEIDSKEIGIPQGIPATEQPAEAERSAEREAGEEATPSEEQAEEEDLPEEMTESEPETTQEENAEEEAEPAFDLEKEQQGFKLIETEEDYWFWNEDMIKRWNKEEQDFTYYWVEIEWRELWRVGNSFFMEGREISREKAYELTHHPKGTSFGRFKINFIGPPKYYLKYQNHEPLLNYQDEPFEIDGNKFHYQQRGKYFPKYGKITALALDEAAEKVWIALEPINQRRKESVTTVQGGHIVEYDISAGPPYHGNLFEIDIQNTSVELHSHKSGVPYFKEYFEGEDVLTEDLKPLEVGNIQITNSKVKIYNTWKQKIAVFDKVSREWSKP